VQKLKKKSSGTKKLKYKCVFRQKKQHASPSITATSATVTGLAVRLENVGHKLHTDNFFSLPGLYDGLHTMAINCFWNATPN
jgi:hypothetical protein